MLLRRFVTPGLAINSYLLCDEESRRGVIIDPARQIEAYLARALADDIEITDIIETHVHADFVSGSMELKEALKGKPIIHCSGMGGAEWIPAYADHVVRDRDEIFLGKTRLQALHTPGHTPEHLIWIVFDTERSLNVPEIAFTGDLLFVGSVGRPDLMGNELQKILIEQLYHSLFDIILQLPDFIEIFPSHGSGSLCGKEISMRESSTLGYEKRCNPWLQLQPFEQWQYLLLKNMPAAPSYFKKIKKINIQGIAKTTINSPLPIFLDHACFLKEADSMLLIDARSAEKFGQHHYQGSINIPFGPSFPTWVASVVLEAKPIILIVETAANAMQILESLKLIDMNHVYGIFAADQWVKGEQIEKMNSMPTIDVSVLSQDLSKYYVLDVRTPQEWSAGHIDNAHHIELTSIPTSMHQIPQQQAIAVICRSGARSSVAASLLKRAGFSQAMNVSGGMQAWMKAALPIKIM